MNKSITPSNQSDSFKLKPTAWYFVKAMVQFLFSAELRLARGDIPPQQHRIADDFCGVCVATSPDPSCDAYILRSLQELGLQHVRLDYGYDSPDLHGARLLETLLNRGYRVMLHLVQPLEEAAAMERPAARKRWQDFVETALDRWGSRVELIEIGSTVNRRRWAGYTPAGFAACWQTAFMAARARGLKISGPNISDFEPLYTIALLDVLKSMGQPPEYYTENLFVERVIQPEVYDHRIFGKFLASLVRYNLVRKARLLQRIAVSRGVAGMICTYVSWSLPRIKRFLPEAKSKQADYLCRYLVLAAASGAFHRVYWGALINCREGLIDDAHAVCPNEEIITFYGDISGNSQLYRPRPAFYALQTFQQLIPGSVYQGALSQCKGLEIHEFLSATQRIHVLWTVNAGVAVFTDIYEQLALDRASWLSRDGDSLQAPLSLVTEAPVYLIWPLPEPVAMKVSPKLIPELAVCHAVSGSYYHFRDEEWEGLILAQDDAQAQLLIDQLHPGKIQAHQQKDSLRYSRNAIWTISDPRAPEKELVVKQPVRLSWNKKLSEKFKPSKARRSWNGACELLRRGISSPLPVAYFERVKEVDLLHNWYVCERESSDLSVRHYFTIYANGSDLAHGIARDDFLGQLCKFVLEIHQRGVFFRDLSGGNVLVKNEADGSLVFSLIDTARAHFFPFSVPLRKRLADLVRILHKLDWPGRLVFLREYCTAIDRKFTLIWRLPFYLYDLKAGSKRNLRARKRKS